MKKIVKLTEKDLNNIIKRVIKESDYSTDIDRPTQPREKDIKSMFGPKYGSYIPNDVLRYLRKNPKLVFERLYEIYGQKAYEYLDMAKGGSDMGIMESEEHMKNDRYMFFSNLEQMQRQSGLLLDLDHNKVESILDNGHDWAQDHIAEAKNNMDQVFDFIMNETKSFHKMGDEVAKPFDMDVVEEGKELTEKKKKNTATNKKLWQQSLAWARSRYKVCPSAYCNGAAVKHYNSKGGKWVKK
jgi:hypothetical protein